MNTTTVDLTATFVQYALHKVEEGHVGVYFRYTVFQKVVHVFFEIICIRITVLARQTVRQKVNEGRLCGVI